jgi:hypothetical protein
MQEIAIDPALTADATHLTLPSRTSPTAKSPGMLVSSMYGRRVSGQCAAPRSSTNKSEPVFRKPFSSSVRQPSSHSVFGSAPPDEGSRTPLVGARVLSSCARGRT